jgi:hypothetical protein
MLNSNHFVYVGSFKRFFTQTNAAWRFSLFGVFIAACTFQLGFWQPASQAAKQLAKAVVTQRAVYRSLGGQHKVRITDATLAEKLRTQGARLLAQYEYN